MNLPLNNLQIKFLAELLEPHRNSDNRQARALVRKMDWLVQQQAERDKKTAALMAAIKAGNTPPNVIICTRESIFGKENNQ